MHTTAQQRTQEILPKGQISCPKAGFGDVQESGLHVGWQSGSETEDRSVQVIRMGNLTGGIGRR